MFTYEMEWFFSRKVFSAFELFCVLSSNTIMKDVFHVFFFSRFFFVL